VKDEKGYRSSLTLAMEDCLTSQGCIQYRTTKGNCQTLVDQFTRDWRNLFAKMRETEKVSRCFMRRGRLIRNLMIDFPKELQD
jgi:hypothetical protein